MLVLAAITAVSCSKDQVGETYTSETDDPSMLYSVFSEVELGASLESISIPVVRTNTSSEFTLDLVVCVPDGVTVEGTAGETDEKGNTLYATSLKFDAGVSQASVVFDITKMEVGNKYNGYMVFADNVKYNDKIAVDSCAFTLAKAYTWVSLGEGEYYDAFVGNYNPVEILKADGFERYRVLEPYPADVLTGEKLGYLPAGSAWGIGGAACPYIEYWVLENGVNVAWAGGYSTTLDYDGNGSTIYMWYPADYSAKYAPLAETCMYMDEAKTWIQFETIAYIPALGEGFGNFNAYISLPGGPKLSDVLGGE